ncbi:MAG: CopG family transcriptional regulator [Rhodoferax sp.]|uniref:ribbon-helix-helix domain-containing protein n=1 Tax=Rhodoferax sp. TaxID=50421 RepID=UPI003BB1A58E
MHRTQIYLQNELYDTLKSRAASMRVSISELIRRTLERDIHKDPVVDAQAYFERLQPLESFAAVDAETYVRNIRSQSRILRQSDTT